MAHSSLAFGSAGDGPAVVLLHAFPYDRTLWRPQVEGLADGYRVVTVDLPGFGRTPVPAGGWTVDEAADAVADTLDGLGLTEPVVVGGLSMGGYVALAVARRHPQRLRGLILADTRAEPDGDEAKAGRAKTMELARAKGAEAVFEDAIPKQLCEVTRDGRPAVVAEARQIAGRQSVEGIVAALAALRDRPDARPGLADIRVPTLVLVGEHDAITPLAAAEVLAKGIAGARLEVLPAAGHLSNLETPAVFTSAVRAFLSEVR
jgi:pimeloyl-ACP methyl ester carboxylesterase